MSAATHILAQTEIKRCLWCKEAYGKPSYYYTGTTKAAPEPENTEKISDGICHFHQSQIEYMICAGLEA